MTLPPSFTTRLVDLDTAPAAALPWMTLDQSATATIRATTGTLPQVQILHSGDSVTDAWLPTPWEVNHPCFARHISLNLGQHACLIGRSIAQADGEVATLLKGLGTRPLAELLFKDGSTALPEPIYLVSDQGWFGRAVQWQVAGCADPLLLIELFNPEFVSRYAPTA